MANNDFNPDEWQGKTEQQVTDGYKEMFWVLIWFAIQFIIMLIIGV